MSVVYDTFFPPKRTNLQPITDFDKRIKEDFERATKPVDNPNIEDLTALKNRLNKGQRFDSGKLRYDLVPAIAQREYVKILTVGANKYSERNWEKGMLWSKVIGSMERHIAAFKLGEDRDPETGELHMAHAMCNAAFLVEYYHTYPQGDDRQHDYLKRPKIGLDIDEVLCDWVGCCGKKFGYEIPENWNFSYENKAHFDSFSPEELSEFYLNLPAKLKASEIPFEPHCYITSRSVPLEITKQWLIKNGFPAAPVYSVGFGVSKVEVAKESGIDWFVDDKINLAV